MIVRVLGSGTSTGVPVIGCKCSVCVSKDSYNIRGRASVAIEIKDFGQIVIDTGPEFRLQVLREDISKLAAVFYTHLHADHCAGLDDLRAFSFKDKSSIPVYISKEFEAELRSRFYYVFEETGYRGSKPKLDLNLLTEGPIAELHPLDIEMFRLPHGSIMTSAFRIERFFYATDFKKITDSQISKLRGKIDVAIMSGIHFGEHESHSTVPETIAWMNKLEVKRGWITHLAHNIDYFRDRDKLPNHIEFAYDGLKIELD